MMYSCIAKLNFFDEFRGDKNQLVQELENINSGKKDPNAIFDVAKQYNSNIDLNINNKTPQEIGKYRDNIKNENKKCGC